ncbi:MGH1-like glycoside hydrolase domain-containing protein [Pseudogemmobacter bohemicus]|uniref:MGH1-like glycoside hydrolase domain-containing protein n=1 Tax=Pseudogemmobacter bohemicus TaxID=2250708 RepID=UPI0018E58EBA|nr:trehalase family glycosidase [Pseudogemmobacter bohemicus]
MPMTTTLPLSRLWFTWGERPAEMIFQPLGLRITPVLYSTRLRKTSVIEPRSDLVRLGPHRLDGGYTGLETEFAGTPLGFHAGTVDPFSVQGGWKAGQPAEWAARFWVVLAVSAEGAEARFDAASGAVIIRQGHRRAVIVSRDPAIVVTGHEDLAALRNDLEENGYFNLESRATTAPLLALRFNLDMMREGAWAAALADSEALAIQRARAALDAPMPEPGHLHSGDAAGALDAIRDITGWNTVWDEENARPYTKVTRIWNLGRFAVWYNDQCYAALLAGVIDPDLARQNMAVAHGGATPQGNIACIVTSHDAWVDRSQPPLGSLVAWLLYQRSGERSVLTAQYEALLRNHRWWRRERDPDHTGLISCGSSDVGEALYQGTHFGARNETGMDNSATHDEAVWQGDRRSLSTWDLGLNCVVALDAEMLSLIAAGLGDTATATGMRELAEAHRRLIREKLWDPARQIFANRQRGGDFVRALSPTSFYPMLCGAADVAQQAALIRHMEDPKTFAAPWPLPNATRYDPAYQDNVYWRGRIWPNVNYLVWLGLHRVGEARRAAQLAADSYALFRKNWDEARIAGENYNPETGEVLDQGDADGFYIWAGLLPLMAVEEICGFSPWTGWSLQNGPDCRLGPLESPLGPVVVERREGTLTLRDRADAARLISDIPGRISHIRFGEGSFSCEIPACAAASLSLPQISARDVLAIELDGQPLPHGGADGPLILRLAAEQPARLAIWFRNVRHGA